MRNAAECTGKSEDAELAFRRFRGTGEKLAHIHQFVECVDNDDTRMFDERTHDRVIAGKGACMRSCSLSSLCSAAGVHHYDRLAAPQGLAGDVDKFLGTPYVLSVQCDDLCNGIFEQVPDEIRETEASLVSGRNPT